MNRWDTPGFILQATYSSNFSEGKKAIVKLVKNNELEAPKTKFGLVYFLLGVYFLSENIALMKIWSKQLWESHPQLQYSSYLNMYFV